MFMRSTKLSATSKLSAEHETPPIVNVLLPAVVSVNLMFAAMFKNCFNVICLVKI